MRSSFSRISGSLKIWSRRNTKGENMEKLFILIAAVMLSCSIEITNGRRGERGIEQERCTSAGEAFCINCFAVGECVEGSNGALYLNETTRCTDGAQACMEVYPPNTASCVIVDPFDYPEGLCLYNPTTDSGLSCKDDYYSALTYGGSYIAIDIGIVSCVSCSDYELPDSVGCKCNNDTSLCDECGWAAVPGDTDCDRFFDCYNDMEENTCSEGLCFQTINGNNCGQCDVLQPQCNACGYRADDDYSNDFGFIYCENGGSTLISCEPQVYEEENCTCVNDPNVDPSTNFPTSYTTYLPTDSPTDSPTTVPSYPPTDPPTGPSTNPTPYTPTHPATDSPTTVPSYPPTGPPTNPTPYTTHPPTDPPTTATTYHTTMSYFTTPNPGTCPACGFKEDENTASCEDYYDCTTSPWCENRCVLGQCFNPGTCLCENVPDYCPECTFRPDHDTSNDFGYVYCLGDCSIIQSCEPKVFDEYSCMCVDLHADADAENAAAAAADDDTDAENAAAAAADDDTDAENAAAAADDDDTDAENAAADDDDADAEQPPIKLN